jgi:hypothetical protein
VLTPYKTPLRSELLTLRALASATQFAFGNMR